MNNIKYLRIITNESCNLKCFFCHKEGVKEKETASISPTIMKKMIDILVMAGIRKIKLMGGEPTLYPNIEEIIVYIRNTYPSIDVSMISNGIADQKKYESIIDSGIKRINISLHGFDPQKFQETTKCHPKLIDRTVENILFLKSKGILGKVNYVILKNTNEDEFFKVLDFVHENDIVLDVLNYLSEEEENIFNFYYSFEEIIKLIEKRYPIVKSNDYVNSNSLPSRRLFLLGGGIVNLKVYQLSQQGYMNSCKNCTKKKYCKEGIAAIRLTAKGDLKPCLFREDNTYDLISLIEKPMEECVSIVKTYFDEL